VRPWSWELSKSKKFSTPYARICALGFIFIGSGDKVGGWLQSVLTAQWIVPGLGRSCIVMIEIRVKQWQDKYLHLFLVREHGAPKVGRVG
jgi:hypothetical protein